MKITRDTTLGELQEYVQNYSKERGFTTDPHAKFLKLVEEVGELSKALGKKMGVKSDAARATDGSVEDELVDVFLVLVGLANTVNIDLGEMAGRKDAKNRTRSWK